MMQIKLEDCRPSLKPSLQITSLPPTKLTTKCIAAARLANQTCNYIKYIAAARFANQAGNHTSPLSNGSSEKRKRNTCQNWAMLTKRLRI